MTSLAPRGPFRAYACEPFTYADIVSPDFESTIVGLSPALPAFHCDYQHVSSYRNARAGVT